MKNVSRLLSCLFFATISQFAQPQTRPIGESLDYWVTNAEKEIVSAADAMPEEKYSFAPTAGEFTGARTFAGQVKHLSASNYQLAAHALQESPRHGEHGENAPESIRTKAQVMDYLKGSFADLHRAVATIREDNMLQSLGAKGPRTRLDAIVDAVAHSYDHYGQMVEYLRMNGIVPPASRK